MSTDTAATRTGLSVPMQPRWPASHPCLLLALLLAPPAARAQAPQFQFEPGIALTTDRVWRGLSDTRGRPAVIGELKWEKSNGPLVGLWASNASDERYGDYAHLLPFAGYNWSRGNFSGELAYLRHLRLGAHPTNGTKLDFSELNGSVSYQQPIGSLNASIDYSPDYYAGGTSAYEAVEVSVRLAKLRTVRYSAFTHFGTTQFSRPDIPNYSDWKVGLRASRAPWFASAALTSAHPGVNSPVVGSKHAGTRFALTITFVPD